jgi:nascent polypeptide-associated complex subunit alpha
MADTDTIINSEQGKSIGRLEKKARQTLAKLGLKKVEGIQRVVMRRPGNVGFCAYINVVALLTALRMCHFGLHILQVLFVVSNPEVFRAPGSDCYIVFGEVCLRALTYAARCTYDTSFQAQLNDQSGGAFSTQAMAAAQAAHARQEAEAARKARAGGDSAPSDAPKAGVDPNEVFAGVGEEKQAEGADDDNADIGDLDESDIDTVMKQSNVSRGKAISVLKKHDGDIVNAIMEAAAGQQ